MHDAPRLSSLTAAYCREIWIRISQRHQRPNSWDLVVLLERNLYGHHGGPSLEERS